MTIEAISSNALPTPAGPFSPAVRSGGFIFMSGQVGQDPATGKLVAGGVEAEARQIFRNAATLLDAAGKGLRGRGAGRHLPDRHRRFRGGQCHLRRARSRRLFRRGRRSLRRRFPLGATIEIEFVVEG